MEGGSKWKEWLKCLSLSADVFSGLGPGACSLFHPREQWEDC
jgi:hypothetical protein